MMPSPRSSTKTNSNPGSIFSAHPIRSRRGSRDASIFRTIALGFGSTIGIYVNFSLYAICIESIIATENMAKLKKRQQDALREINLDLFSPQSYHIVRPETRATDELPSEPELYCLFDSLNGRYFGSSLPRPTIEWSTRMKHAGKCEMKGRVIRLGRAYHEHYPEDVVDTLKHEMIHLIYPNHGPEFKREAERIGTSRYARQYPGMLKGLKYLYVCPTCGTEFPSRKMLRMRSCGPCSGGRYNGKHKLQFVRKL